MILSEKSKPVLDFLSKSVLSLMQQEVFMAESV